MTVLLDTSLAVWMDQDPNRLSREARHIIEGDGRDCLLSVVSIWEMEVKSAIGKLTLSSPVEQAVNTLIANYRIKVIPLDRDACHQLAKIGSLRGDPFDRMLVCQAISLGVPIVTADRGLASYPVRTIW